MTKLILEEGGQRRAFKLGEGVLTVGSGEASRLRLDSPAVAEVHLELELVEGRLRVTPRPGVLPPTVGGEALSGPRELSAGEQLVLGDAKLWIEGEEAAAPAQPRSAGVGSRGGSRTRTAKGAKATAKGAKATARGARATAKRASSIPRGRIATPGRNRSVVHRSKPRVQRGLPGWLIAALLLAGVAVAVAILLRGFQQSAEQGTSPIWATIQAAEEQLEGGNFESARKRLDAIPPAREVSPEEQQRIVELRAAIERRAAEADQRVANLSGTKFLDDMLKAYEAKYLGGDPDPAKIRFFLARLAEFRRRWPTHPETSWVDRQEARYRGVVDLASPRNRDEVLWEIEYLREQPVRKFSEMFSLLDGHVAREGDDPELRKLRAELESERQEYFTDRLYQAEYEFNQKGDEAKSVWWLINLAIYVGDEQMSNEAASFLVKIPGLEAHLRAYEQQYPERYRAIMSHPIVRPKARELGLR